VLSVDLQELEIIYEKQVDGLYQFFYSRCCNREVAEDLTSESFLKFSDAVKRLGGTPPEKYLYGIAKNVFNSYLRKKYGAKEIPSGEYIEDLEQDISACSSSLYVRQRQSKQVVLAIENLPSAQAVIIHEIMVNRKTLTEIAQDLGKDLNYVKTTKKRAVKNLRKLLGCTP